MNRYRVVPTWDDIETKKEVVVEASYFKSSTFDGRPITEFYDEGRKKKNSEDDELVAIFWGEIIVIKMPEVCTDF